MRIVVAGFKKGFSIFWDDSILLIVMNFICFLSLLPALLFFTVTNTAPSILVSLFNTVLFLPAAFFIFALYHVLFDARRGIVISFRSFFGYVRSTWKQALLFGVVNIVVVLLVGWNLRFYEQFDAAWAGIVQAVFVSITMVWVILQIVMLPLYPRLNKPSFKLAMKNSGALFGGYLFPVLLLTVWTILFVVLTVIFQALGMLFSLIFIAALGEGIVGEIVIDVKGPSEEGDTQEE